MIICTMIICIIIIYTFTALHYKLYHYALSHLIMIKLSPEIVYFTIHGLSQSQRMYNYFSYHDNY